MKLAIALVFLILTLAGAVDFVSETELYVGGRFQPNYFSGSGNVSRLAVEIAQGATSPQEAAYQINSWIKFKGKYDLDAKYWPSDAAVLESGPTGVCLDFAGLEVGMLRSLGIPSRVIYATLDQVEGHAWVEFFDGETWVQSDPTYGTFDSERYYCYLGYDILEIYTVIDGELVTMDKLGYTDCEQKSDYLDVLIWAPLSIVIIISAAALIQRHIKEKEEAELEQAEKEGKDWL